MSSSSTLTNDIPLTPRSSPIKVKRKTPTILSASNIKNAVVIERIKDLRNTEGYFKFVFGCSFPVVYVTIPTTLRYYSALTEGRFKGSGVMPSLFLFEFLYALVDLVEEEYVNYFKEEEKEKEKGEEEEEEEEVIVVKETEGVEKEIEIDHFDRFYKTAHDIYKEELLETLGRCNKEMVNTLETSSDISESSMNEFYREIVRTHEVFFGKMRLFLSIAKISNPEIRRNMIPRLDGLSNRKTKLIETWIKEENFKNFVSPLDNLSVLLDENIKEESQRVYIEAVRRTVHKQDRLHTEKEKKKQKKKESLTN